MARITVEDCLENEPNRFALVQLASKRTKQLLHGSQATIEDIRNNKAVVTALREVASGSVRFMTEEELAESKAKEEELLEAMNPPSSPEETSTSSEAGDSSSDSSDEEAAKAGESDVADEAGLNGSM